MLGTRAPDRVIAGSSQGHLWLVDCKAGRTLVSTTVGLFTLNALKVDEDRRHLVLSDAGGWVQVLDVSSWYTPRPRADMPTVVRFQAHVEPIVGFALLPRGFLATASKDCSVRVWTATGRCVGVLGQVAPWDLEDEGTWLWPNLPEDLVWRLSGWSRVSLMSMCCCLQEVLAPAEPLEQTSKPSIATLTKTEEAAERRASKVPVPLISSGHLPSSADADSQHLGSASMRLLRRTTIHRRRLEGDTFARHSTAASFNTLPCVELAELQQQPRPGRSVTRLC